jgi:hypothetical protein
MTKMLLFLGGGGDFPTHFPQETARHKVLKFFNNIVDYGLYVITSCE